MDTRLDRQVAGSGPSALPRIHHQRVPLNDEVHARPPDAMAAPSRLSHVAMLTEWPIRDEDWHPVSALAEHFGAPFPNPGSNHFSADLGPMRLRWERHTEFTRYTFSVPGVGADPFADPAIRLVPADWLASLPGELLVATHVALVPAGSAPVGDEAGAMRDFGGHAVVGAELTGGTAAALTDFRIHEDGFGRILVRDGGMGARQTGRNVQRLLEIDTYRVMALLALPVARELIPFLADCEEELVRITAAMTGADERDEPELLDSLTRLEAAIERRHSENHYRFAAAGAYYGLVQARIEELRERRIEGVQPFSEFTGRRLEPAIHTCEAVARRQEALSRRVARATQLLTTRVGITRERQNQDLLESMNRRARLQLRLQETVELLSIAAVTYYGVGLVGYAVKGLKAFGLAADPEIAMAVSIPIIAYLVARIVRKVRRIVLDADPH